MAKRSSRGLQGPLGDYEGSWLECRNLGHIWKVWGYYRRGADVYRHLDCQRCHTERVDHWGSNGARLGNRYHYIDGYQLRSDDDHPRITTTDVRLEMMTRAKVFASEEAMVEAMTNA
jgi:hypothetical protein